MIPLKYIPVFLTILFCICSFESTAQSANPGSNSRVSQLITRELISGVLSENKIGLDLKRQIKIYLPPNYSTSTKSYPVVYFLHNMFWSNDQMFADGKVVSLMDRAIANGDIQEFIMVVPDYRSATTGSLYANSPISGRWIDHTIQEVIPFIDKNFRTIPDRSSRAVVGEFMGGRGALVMAMTHPDYFSVVYALHPVATGMGELPWKNLNISWDKFYDAKKFPDPTFDGISQIFISVCQAFLPNPNRPPLYCDFFMEPVNGVPTVHVENMKKAQAGFTIDFMLANHYQNLKRMKAIAFDWARFDPNYAHVDSNREFSRKLVDFGIEHEAEEYSGALFTKTWTDDGRFYLRVLPFLARHLNFQADPVGTPK